METLRSPEFWGNQITAALNAWAIVIPLLLILWAAHQIKLAKLQRKMRKLGAHNKAVESRLQAARDLNAGEANNLDQIRSQVDELRKLVGAKAEPTVVEPLLKEVDESAATLSLANLIAANELR